MTVLIVDDNEQMRRMIRNFLKDLVTEIFECNDGAVALLAYNKYQPDWVLMDIKMKEVSGIVATRQIKAAFPQAKIMILTDYDDADLREEAEKAGADAYVIKENLLVMRQFLQATL